MQKSTTRRRSSSVKEDDIFSARKKYFRANNNIYSLDKDSLDLISMISSKLRKSLRPKQTSINKRTELQRYFEERD
jgi:hypothetical protein